MLNRIWKKFTIALLVVAFVPISYFGYQDLQAAKLSVADKALREIFLNCVTRSKTIEQTFLNANYDISDLRSSVTIEFLLDTIHDTPEDALYWKNLVEKEFIRFLGLKSGYSSVGFLDDYGNETVVVSRFGKQITALNEVRLLNRLTSPYYVGAAMLHSYGIAATPMRNSVHPAMNLEELTLIRYTTKVFDRNGKPGGVLYLDLNGSEILRGLTQKSLGQLRPTALVTSKGNYIHNPFYVPSPSDSITQPISNIKSSLPKKVTEQILSGRTGIIEDDPDELYAYSAIYPQSGNTSRYYVVFDRYPRKQLASKLYGIKKMYATGAVGALVLTIVVAVFLSRALTSPISRLREGVEKFSRRDMSQRIVINSRDEIESLAAAYNQMADSLQEYSESLERKVEQRSNQIKQVERKLMQAEKLAALGFLSAGVAHEINNPIAIIITRLELMEKALDKGDGETVRKDVKALKNHALRIGKIAGSLLTFSRDDSRSLEAVDLNATVDRVIDLIEYPVVKKKIKLVRDLADDLPMIWASPTGMEQVIYNIIYNAYQATDEKGRITVRTRPVEREKVELIIADTGGGIPKSAIKHIFEPFFTTKEVGQGTGLGLSISYGFIHDFGGAISVDSKPGEGTVFTIVLDTASARLKERKDKDSLIVTDV